MGSVVYVDGDKRPDAELRVKGVVPPCLITTSLI